MKSVSPTLLRVLFFLLAVSGGFSVFVGGASAYLAPQPCSGPYTGAETGYPGYGDLQFDCPIGMVGQPNTASYDFNCTESLTGADSCTGAFGGAIGSSFACGTAGPWDYGGSNYLFYGCSGDVIPPSTVPNMVATGVSTNAINITWDPATDNVGVFWYSVEFLKIGDLPLRLGVVPHTGASSYAFTDGPSAILPAILFSGRTLIPNTTYMYRVTAHDAPFPTEGNTNASSDSGTTLLANPDTTAPSVPSGLSATPASTSQINLFWNASTDPTVGGAVTSGLAGYRVYRDGTLIASNVTTNAYSDTGLSPSTTYSYTVDAFDAIPNYSAQASSVSPRTLDPQDATAPSAPSNLNATAASSSRIDLSWSASTDPVVVGESTSGLAGYRIYRNGSPTPIVTVGAGVTTYSDTGLAPVTTYTYTVAAFDNAGNQSPMSNQDSDTTQAAADTTAPTTPTLSGTVASATRIDLSWTASTDPTVSGQTTSGLNRYEVYRNGSLVTTLGTSVISYSNTGLAPATSYSFFIRAFDNTGNSITSNTVMLSTPSAPDTTAPSVPTGLNAVPASSSQINLSWNASTDPTVSGQTTSGLAGYRVYRDGALAGSVAVSATSFADTGRAESTTYTYTVSAYDGAGNESAQSGQEQATTPDTTPPQISNGQPVGALSAAVTSVTLAVDTNEPSYCRYATTNTDFFSMTGAVGSDFTRDAARTHHTATLAVSAGNSYLYYVRCQDDPAGNVNTTSYIIAFSVATPPNALPVAVITVVPTSGDAPLPVSASAAGSSDPDGSIIEYRWSWGSASLPDTIGPANATQTYTTAGTYTMTLRVVDNQGGVGQATQTIAVTAPAQVLPPPPPTAGICAMECNPTNPCVAPNICSPAGYCVAQGSIGTGPVRDNGVATSLDGSAQSPPGTLPEGTKSAILSVTTDVNAQCQYATQDVPYGSSQASLFTSTGLTSHSVTLTGLGTTPTQSGGGRTFTYYVRCKDTTTGEVNTSTPLSDSEYPISLTIGGSTLVTGPSPYTCFINQSFIKNFIPYFFDVCIPGAACVPTTCVAPAPACGTTTSGTDNCGSACTRVGSACAACVVTTCSAPAPACGTTTSGTDNCGNPCTRVGSSCAGCVPIPITCSAPAPACGTSTSGTDNCGPCIRTAPACTFYGGIHTPTDCTSLGGTVVDDGTYQFCRMSGSSCLAGWTVYTNPAGVPWTTTTANTCTGTGGSCITGSHTWNDIPVASEQCPYIDNGNMLTCSVITAQIGCY